MRLLLIEPIQDELIQVILLKF